MKIEWSMRDLVAESKALNVKTYKRMYVRV